MEIILLYFTLCHLNIEGANSNNIGYNHKEMYY